MATGERVIVVIRQAGYRLWNGNCENLNDEDIKNIAEIIERETQVKELVRILKNGVDISSVSLLTPNSPKVKAWREEAEAQLAKYEASKEGELCKHCGVRSRVFKNGYCQECWDNI